VEVSELDQQIDVLDGRLSMVSDQAAAFQAATLRLSTLRAEVVAREQELRVLMLHLSGNDKGLQDDLADIGVQCRTTREAIERRLADVAPALRRQLDAIAAEIAAVRDDLNERIANNGRLLSDADAIRAAAARVVAIDAEVAGARQRRDATTRDLTIARERIGVFDKQLAVLDAKAAELARAERDSAVIQTVPFGDACAPCPFLKSAVTARGTVDALRAELAERPAVEAGRGEVLMACDASTRTMMNLDAELFRLAQERTTAVARSANSGEIDAAEARIEEYRRQLAGLDGQQASRTGEAAHHANRQTLDLQEQLATVNTDESQRTTQARDRHIRRAQELTLQVTTATTTRDRLASDLDTAESDLRATEADSQQAQTITADLADCRRRRDAALATVARAQTESAGLQRQRTDIAAKRVELSTLDGKCQRLDTELLEWQTLQKAFSRDGLPTLEIDAAGPTVSAYTNELLLACFGARFTVELVTQQAKADGKGLKESFEVKVYDNEHGGDPRDIADLSGGEQIIVSEALMNAIGLFVNTRSRTPIRTCWRDETTGPLDAENGVRYLQMLRKVHALGGFHHTFFISHNPDIAAMADAQIRVVDGQAAIVLAPYSEAA
jgi:exonuclease SbcC